MTRADLIEFACACAFFALLGVLALGAMLFF